MNVGKQSGVTLLSAIIDYMNCLPFVKITNLSLFVSTLGLHPIGASELGI